MQEIYQSPLTLTQIIGLEVQLSVQITQPHYKEEYGNFAHVICMSMSRNVDETWLRRTIQRTYFNLCAFVNQNTDE